MKRILIMLTMAAGIAACNSSANTNAGSYQTTQKYKDSLKLDSFKRADAVAKEIDRREQEAALAQAKSAPASVQSNSTSHIHHTSATTPAKRGWSSAAKGAAIGAGAGAVTGILIDKKDGRGAVIGGVVGAGTGYAIGRAKDKKTGRAQ